MTLIQQLEQQQAEITALKAANADLTARVEKSEADGKAKDELLAKSDAAIKAACEETKAAQDACAIEQKAHGETKDRLDKAEKALANPAHMAAAVEGMKQATAEGGTPASEEPITREQAIAAYNKLPDGIEGAKARADFRAKHKELLGL